MRLSRIGSRSRAWICAALACLAALAAAPAAQATIYSVSPADRDGPEDAFNTGDALWVIGTSNPQEGAAQVCVVEPWVAAGNCREVGIWGRPNAVSFLGTYHQPIDAPPLAPGTYRILADNDDDPFDDNQADIVSEPFSVGPCAGEQCTPEVAKADMDDWKATAAAARTGMGMTCASVSSFGGLMLSAGSGTLSEDDREVIMAELKGDDQDLDLKKPKSSKHAAISFLRKVSCATYLMYDDIVHDPADPDYKHVSEPQVESLGTQLSDIVTVNTAATTLEDIRAYGEAHRVGLERYQGAAEKDDDTWSSYHAGRVGEQALGVQLRMRRLGRELRTAAAELEDAEIEAVTPEELERVKAARARILTSGFTPGELNQLDELGVSDADVEVLRAQLGAPLPDVTPLAPGDALEAAADEIDKATCIDVTDLCGFDRMGRLAGALGAATAVPPTVTVGEAQLREGDRGINHIRIPFTLSHPATHAIGGNWTVDPGSTSEGEVGSFLGLAGGQWTVPAFETRTYVTMVVVNDTVAEADEVAQITAQMGDGRLMEPIAFAVLDDDGEGDPPKPVRAGRGLIAWISPRPAGPTLMMAEPDGTNVTEVDTRPEYSKHQVVDWSPDGRLLLIQFTPNDLAEQNAVGQRLSTVRIGEDGDVLGPPVELTQQEPLVNNPRFSPDSSRIVMSQYAGNGNWVLSVLRVDRDGGPDGPAHVTGDDPALAGWYSLGATWAPNGDRLAFGGCAPSLACGTYTVGVDEDGAALGSPATLHERTGPSEVWNTQPAWSPDGRFLAELAGDMSAPLLHALAVDADGDPLGSPPVPLSDTAIPVAQPGPGAPADWAPDSRGIAYLLSRDPLTRESGPEVPVVRSLDADGHPVGAVKELQPNGWPTAAVAWARLPDETPPVTTAEITPEANAAGWHRDDVTVRLTADDPGFGSVDHIAYSLGGAASRVDVDGDEATVTVSGEGTRVLRYRAVDARGNAEPERTLTLRIDRTKPAVAIQSPAGAHEAGSRVVAAYTCTDAGSGIAACAGDASAGAALATGTPGARTFGVTATDRAGNEANAASAWSVFARATAPPTPPAAPAPPAAAPPSTEAATLPSSRRCVSRRRFRIRLRAPRGDPLASARVFVNGKRVHVLRGKRLTAPINLRGLPKGRFQVKVTTTTRSGRTLTSTRRYRTCTKKRRPR